VSKPKGIGDTVIGSQQLVEKGVSTSKCKDKKCMRLRRAKQRGVSNALLPCLCLNQLLVTNTSKSIRSFRTLKFTNFNFDSAPFRWLFYFAFFIPNFAILTKL
jgi:hypothetical protein